MTASAQPESRSTSRRALLAGALGGIGAWAASTIGRASPARAEGEAIMVGGEYDDATSLTRLSNTANSATVFQASNTAGGHGILGTTNSAFGVYGTSSLGGTGVVGSSDSGIGVSALSAAIDKPASLGRSTNNSTGVQGHSGGGVVPPAPKARTGVYGYAAQDNTSNGVFGESPAGRAIAGYSSSGYAGYFSGRVFSSKWYELAEITTPASPSANRARLFVRDSAGKTQLAVKFPNGTVLVLATEA